MLTQKSEPGISDIGTLLTSAMLWDAAMATMTIGPTATKKPSNRIRWVKKFRMGVRSIMSASTVMHTLLDEAELEDGQHDDQQH